MSIVPENDNHSKPSELDPSAVAGASTSKQPEQAMPADSAQADEEPYFDDELPPAGFIDDLKIDTDLDYGLVAPAPKKSGAPSAPRRPDPALATLSTEVLDFFATRETSEPAPQNLITTTVTRKYLERLDSLGDVKPELVEQHMLSLANTVIRNENAKLPKGDPKLPPMRHLNYWQVAQVLIKRHRIVQIAPNAKDTDREYDLLAMYQPSGRAKGVYTTSEDEIRMAARAYNAQLTLNDFKEVLAVLKEDAPRTHQCSERDLVAVNNGVFFYGSQDRDIQIGDQSFHFKAKSLRDFNPAFIFLAKSHIDYIKDAPAQFITNPEDGTVWDVESWIEEFFDQPGQEGMAELIWETIGAIVRPRVRWGKTAWFYSEQGNNGKGTLCALMRNLVGAGSHTSIPLSDFGKDFALEPLVRASAIIVDENDVGTFIDKAANLKAIVTNDVIQINRKFRMHIAFQFWGFMVQCLNEFPLVKDKSESFYRRQLFVPFTKSFTGKEKRYIKDDYLERREVLEYVLWYVLHRAGSRTPGSYYVLSEPIATKVVLSEYKETNDPVRAFWQEFKDQFVWDLLPIPFLYDLFKAWFSQVSPSGSVIGRQRFGKDLQQIVQQDDAWYLPRADKVRPGLLMNDPEPLIAEFELKTWFNPAEKTSKNPNPARLSTTQPSANYRQPIMRRTLATVGTAAPSADDTTND